MRNWRDRDTGSSFQKPEFAFLNMRTKMVDGVPKFTWYDREKKEDKFYSGKIKGYLLGYAFQSSAYEKSTKNMYQSSIWFKKDKFITWHNGQKFFEGNKDKFQKYLTDSGIKANVKTKLVVFVLNDKGMVYAISTHPGIGLHDLKKNRDAFKENYIVVSANLYNANDGTITDNTVIKNLSGIDNLPVPARLNAGEAITDQAADKMDIDGWVAKYEKYEAFYGGGNQNQQQATPSQQQSAPPNHMKASDIDPLNESLPTSGASNESIPGNSVLDQEDDLPF